MSYFDLSQKLRMCKCCKSLFAQRRNLYAYCHVCQDARKRFTSMFPKEQGDF